MFRIKCKCLNNFRTSLVLIICFVKQRQVSKSMFANLISVLYFICFHYRLCFSTNFDIDSSRDHPSHLVKWHRTKKSPAIKWPIFTVFRATSCHWGPMYLVDSKSSEFVVEVSSCNIKIVWLHHMVWRYIFTFLGCFRCNWWKIRIHKSQKL